ncbi:hypothetical protein IWX50DRAFT_616336 [Phyllosticta citricarpa]|uniref:C3H1-type domain-containing protein n=1 Tax=Phyllosticta citricarpa TaxID=55181 RepID=A0ABR1M7H2_9PEZI
MADNNDSAEQQQQAPTGRHRRRGALQHHQPAAAPPRGATKRRACRFYASKSGCRAGDDCPFAHDAAAAARSQHQHQHQHQQHASQSPGSSAVATESECGNDASSGPPKQQHAPPAPVSSDTPAVRVDGSRVVQRPTPRAQAEDPRQFQLSQIRRRFAPKERQEANGSTIMEFGMKPSDPDFPFDIDALQCTLVVPASYGCGGGAAPPRLRVTNSEMDRGFQINVERGFDAVLAAGKSNTTLLAAMNALDKRLETLLTAQPAETFSIKIVPNAAAKETPDDAPTAAAEVAKKGAPPQMLAPSALPAKPSEPAYSTEQRDAARARREQELRQLEARLQRLPQFTKLADGLFVLPVEPRKRADLPLPLQAVKTVELMVPEAYPLQPCRVQLQGIEERDASPLEHAFVERVGVNPNWTLMNHINYLSANMHTMAREAPRRPEEATVAAVADQMAGLGTAQASSAAASAAGAATAQPIAGNANNDQKGHIVTIPRPPEWHPSNAEDDVEDEDSDESYADDSEEDGQDEDAVEGPRAESSPAAGPERGIALSFPHLELSGIELLELVNLCLTVKCTRCKDMRDLVNIKPQGAANKNTDVRTESCEKCANVLSIGYRMDMMHANSVRAGHLDLNGCTPVDLLTSNFIPTCSGCSTPYPSPGIASVRGENAMAICRACHKKMGFRIPEVKFLLVSASTGRAARPLPRKKARENLGIIAGQELPRRGRCTHYAKSFRWFRCHDAEAGHPNEHANRMICGHCSREQNFRPEDCGVCHATLIGKKGSGFWEGGKVEPRGALGFPFWTAFDRQRLIPALPLDIPAAARHQDHLALASMDFCCPLLLIYRATHRDDQNPRIRTPASGMTVCIGPSLAFAH